MKEPELKTINPRVFYEAIKECLKKRRVNDEDQSVVVAMPEWVALVLVEYAKRRTSLRVGVFIDDDCYPFAIKTRAEVEH